MWWILRITDISQNGPIKARESPKQVKLWSWGANARVRSRRQHNPVISRIQLDWHVHLGIGVASWHHFAKRSFVSSSATMAPATFIEYIWVGNDSQLRSRTRVLDFVPSGAAEVPVITVDCASDGMHPCDHELFLKPRKLFPDPLRGDGGLLVLCDSHQVGGSAALRGAWVAP